MAILKMKKLRLCGIAEEQTQLIRELQLLGSVEIGSPEALTGAQQTQIFRAGDSSSADALSRTSAAPASALGTLKQYETKKQLSAQIYSLRCARLHKKERPMHHRTSLSFC